MSVKVTIERENNAPGISLKDGDVCLLRCGGVVMVEDSRDGSCNPFHAGNSDGWYPSEGVFSGESFQHPFDIIEVLGNGADFLARVEVVVKVKGE